MKKRGRFDYATQQAEEAEQAVIAIEAKQSAKAVQIDAAAALRNPSAYQLPPRQRGKLKEGTPSRTEIERVQMNVRIRPELKRALAGWAGLNGMTVNDAVERAVVEMLERVGS